jgi:AcrR family transcriptional regulator
MSEEKRPYRLNEGAKAQDETRRRIVEATMQLHEEVGPRATTISAIADGAGVQRLTVYRHFPDETAVFRDCTAHWLTLNPLPDPSAWSGITDPRDRMRTALAAFYSYYSGTRRMWRVSIRDVDHVPALQRPMSEVAAFVGSVAEGLLDAFGEIGAEPSPHDRAARSPFPDVERSGGEGTARQSQGRPRDDLAPRYPRRPCASIGNVEEPSLSRHSPSRRSTRRAPDGDEGT